VLFTHHFRQIDPATGALMGGYLRVSTADQNPDHQIDTFLRAGVGEPSGGWLVSAGAIAAGARSIDAGSSRGPSGNWL
jgi:hypothetical protein